MSMAKESLLAWQLATMGLETQNKCLCCGAQIQFGQFCDTLCDKVLNNRRHPRVED